MSEVSPPAAYLRQPSLAGDTVVFVADDDLWRVGIEGGTARRLTAGVSEPATPCLSPDGRWVAFAGRDEHHSEVWVMPAAGGAPRRRTWLGSELAVRGWMPDGRILFTSNHGQPFFRHWHAWAVPADAGTPERVPLGAVDHLAYGTGGACAIGRNTGDPARWKRYRGGRAGQLWVSEAEGRPFVRLDALQGNVTCPMWLAGRLWFVSDASGVGNLHSCRADGSGEQVHTSHRDFYARNAAGDGHRIVYQCGSELWLFEPAVGTPRRLEVQVGAARAQAARRFVDPAENLQGLAMHPQGHSLAAEVRGQVFTMPLWEGAVRRIGGPRGRHRLGQWLGDGATIAAIGDASGEERLVTQPADGSGAAREWPWDIGRVTGLAAAPRGRRVALTNHRNELLVADLDGETCRRIDASDCGRIEAPAWSPCGGWLAYAAPTSPRHQAIKLVDVASGSEPLLASTPEFRDYAPAFDPEGRYLYFLSLRTFDPIYDAVQFELSFPRAARPYLVALQAHGRPPFDPEPRGLQGSARSGCPGADESAEVPAKAPRPLVVHAEGLARRVAAFPVPEGRYGAIAGAAKGRVLWTQLPLAGAHGRGGHKESPGRLEGFDFASGRTRTLVEDADSFVLAADGHSLLVRHAARLRALDATRNPDSPEATRGAAAGAPSRESGWIDLARLRCDVQPPEEWAQMLREVWRLQREQFWRPDMAGLDWPAVYARYAPLLARVATRSELSDLIWELQGELGTSHAYETGGDHRKPPAVALGHLAAELQAVERGWAIVRTVEGDPWDAPSDSPLNAVGVEAVAGEVIVAIGGQPLAAGEPPGARLVHHAGQRVGLTLERREGDAAPSRREVIVTLLADETPARYREWVERNRRHVHESSGGRVGYLHLPDMMAAGFAEFHRYFAAECDRDALIVDVRFNRGGHVSQLLLEKVARRRIGWNVSRWMRPEPYPTESAFGPVVALTNEHAGSDGDIFSHCFKLMGIGTLVGRRTWGGVIGIWPRHLLADGTETTQPEFSFWFADVGFAVENHGTEPQVEVDNTPEDDAFNAPERDRQLARAVRVALEEAQRAGVRMPEFGVPRL